MRKITNGMIHFLIFRRDAATAVTAAKEVAKGMQDKTLSPFIGIRIKPFTEEEVLATGLTLEEIRGRSFKKILDNRAAK